MMCRCSALVRAGICGEGEAQVVWGGPGCGGLLRPAPGLARRRIPKLFAFSPGAALQRQGGWEVARQGWEGRPWLTEGLPAGAKELAGVEGG